jgi:hypothetical protein
MGHIMDVMAATYELFAGDKEGLWKYATPSIQGMPLAMRTPSVHFESTHLTLEYYREMHWLAKGRTFPFYLSRFHGNALSSAVLCVRTQRDAAAYRGTTPYRGTTAHLSLPMKGMQRNASDWKEPESGGELEYEWAQGPTLVSNDIVDLCAVPLRGQLSFENAAQAEATFQARSEKIKSKRRSNWDEWNAEQKRIRTEGDKDGKRRSTRASYRQRLQQWSAAARQRQRLLQPH